jgi:hypothetical protein
MILLLYRDMYKLIGRAFIALLIIVSVYNTNKV